MQILRNAGVTTGLCVVVLALYALYGSPPLPNRPQTFFEVFSNVFRHGNVFHLVTNVVILFLAGRMSERILGPWPFAGMMLACAVLGSLAQLVLVDDRFVGISGPAYGAVGFAVTATADRVRLPFLWMIIAGALALEVALRADTLAVWSHIVSTFIGGSFAMFGSFFGNKGPALKPMLPTHIAQVVAIIEETDEDDAREAETTFLEEGLTGMFVLLDGREVIGCVGYATDDAVEDIAWLSWTYLRGDRAGEGLGSKMMNEMLGKLNGYGVRKIFIATSDYEDFGKKIYAAAHTMYEDFDAAVELTVPGYHGPFEAKIIYGLDNPEWQGDGPQNAAPAQGLRIASVVKADETEDVYGLNWEEVPEGIAGLDFALDTARGKGGRMAVLVIPSDLSAAHGAALESHKFEQCGLLKDYYASGLHQVWWACSLKSTS